VGEADGALTRTRDRLSNPVSRSDAAEEGRECVLRDCEAARAPWICSAWPVTCLAPTPPQTCCVHPSLSWTTHARTTAKTLVYVDLSKVIHLVPNPRYEQKTFTVSRMARRHTGHDGFLVLVSSSAHAPHTHM
jgi:hypothetical protein